MENNQNQKNLNQKASQTLLLSEAEKEQISDLARRNKFIIRDNSFLYPETSIETLESFCKSFRFFENLLNSVSKNRKKIRNKIHQFVKSLRKTYEEAVYIIKEKNTCVSRFKKTILEKRAQRIVEDNKETLYYTMDQAFNLGRKIKKYSPSETQGYY